MQCCLVFDIGKTNKKAFVFNEDYEIVAERITTLALRTDDEGHSCEDAEALRTWVSETADELRGLFPGAIRASHCTTYGASFVHTDTQGQPVAPLYDYLKPLPEELTCWFLKKYGPAEKIASETASPVLGSLNAGLQLLWLKHHKPLTYNTICYSFHLPQWVSTLLLPGPLRPLSPCCCSEMTSVGCHTMLWDFRRRDYHYWVRQEQIAEKLPPLFRAFNNHQLPAATGLHDSSAALIPYLLQFPMPFILLSTGTWCIALNPFSTEPLTPEDLQQDCLCYLTLAGRPVRAARYFGGYEHDRFAQEIAETYGVSAGFYRSDPLSPEAGVTQSRWQAAWTAYETAMQALMEKQVHAVRLAMGRSAVQFLFVDGGFSKNHLYMRLLAAAFPDIRVRAAEIAQATATGAALTVHSGWNRQSLPKQLIRLNA